jgi:starch-binding outer membrane protein, SusD/RagB family
MKKHGNSIVVLLLFVMVAASCKKSFEDKPLNLISEDYIWDANDPSGTLATNYVAFIYSRISTGYSRLNGVPQECATDDAVPSNPGGVTWNIIRGGYSPGTLFDDNWGNAYSAIRQSNIFLANYLRVPWADLNRKKWLPAEVRAVRAYFYYELIKRYGGVPLLGDKVYDPNDEELLKMKRNSFESCVQYIVSELEAVKDSLRPDVGLAARETDPDFGHMRKSVVLAIKAKVLLLAASPLFNPSATPDKDYTGYPTYNADRWKAAADAAKAVIDLGIYGLEPDRYTLVRTRANKEHIFMRMSDNRMTNFYTYFMSPVGYNPASRRSEGRVSPTQELVNAFPMKNGELPFNPDGTVNLASGYNPANPYINRDPRLDQTIFYNGARWLRRAVETFEGGQDKPNITSIPVQTLSGYYAKKFSGNDSNSTTFSNTNYKDDGGFVPAWSIIRYADILLMYAEAQNESAGADASVYSAVEAIRKRAGLSPFALPANLDKDRMREIVRNERRIELAFEESRFWDIRRWKIAKQVYSTTLHGVTVTKNPNGTFTYTPKDLATPYFTDAMYLLPIALKETQINRDMLQNPGY